MALTNGKLESFFPMDYSWNKIKYREWKKFGPRKVMPFDSYYRK